MVPVMNDTKWNELRLAMYSFAPLPLRWRTRDVEKGYVSPWDREWYYHIRGGGYRTIEWVEIMVDRPEQRAALQATLARIHVPGEPTVEGYRVYGYVPVGVAVDYVPPPDEF